MENPINITRIVISFLSSCPICDHEFIFQLEFCNIFVLLGLALPSAMLYLWQSAIGRLGGEEHGCGRRGLR